MDNSATSGKNKKKVEMEIKKKCKVYVIKDTFTI